MTMSHVQQSLKFQNVKRAEVRATVHGHKARVDIRELHKSQKAADTRQIVSSTTSVVMELSRISEIWLYLREWHRISAKLSALCLLSVTLRL